ncbi:DUF2088 domain-containing protein [Candidatus Bipolaricaulota bacterium]|nr:DUF2088 domain-containing protein [Candidatus Bipolaricaulota bacterium]
MDFSQVKVDGIEGIQLPRFTDITQSVPDPTVDDLEDKIREQLASTELKKRIFSGDKVAIAVGSRGIDRFSEVVETLVDRLKELGTRPFIVPAMGSHGGATAEGQKEILHGYGINEGNVGAPIKSSMETVKIAETDTGVPVFFDKISYEADAVIVVNRVKVHTDFQGELESGIHKMMAIGLGKHKGAASLHENGFGVFSELIPEVGQIILNKAPVRLGVGLLENGHDHLCDVKAWDPEDVKHGEKKMLERQKDLMPQLPFDGIDILVVEKMGKDISGSGMDTNVLGRVKEARPDIELVIVLDLTEETHGNATGIGLADITTERLFNMFDPGSTYTNHITAQNIDMAKLPMVLPSDLFAIKTALKTLDKEPQEAKIVRIQDTLHIMELEISEGLISEAEGQTKVSTTSDLHELQFDNEGCLI